MIRKPARRGVSAPTSPRQGRIRPRCGSEALPMTPFTALSTLFLATAASCQTAPDLWQRPAAERMAALVADAATLRTAFEALHPGLFRYQTPDRWQAALDELEERLQRDPTLPGAFLAFSRLANELRCGHTYCNFLNQPRAIQDALFESRPHVPFLFRWLGKRMVVLRDLVDPARLAPGTEIESIDGVAANEMLAALMSIARADGGNDAKRRDYLGVTGGERFAAFDVYLPLFFPDLKGPFRLVTRSPDGTRMTTEVAAMTYEERQAAYGGGERGADATPRAGGGEDPGLEGFEWRREEHALLRMPGWALFDTKWDWAGWLDRRMDELVRDSVPNLVIDLRGNEGGLDCGDPVLAHLVAAPLPARQVRPFVRYRKTPAELDPLLDTWDPSFRDWGKAAVPAPTPTLVAAGRQSYFRLTKYDDDLTAGIQPKGKRYEGRVFVLVDAACSSATFQFAATVKRHRLGTLVGQTTGGNRRGINGGAFFFLRLPNSKIEVDLPLIAGFPATEEPDEGIVPDIAIEPSVADIAAGVDRELVTVRELIRAGR